jgi:hypothetical protein
MDCNPFDIMQRTQSNSLSTLTIIPIVLILFVFVIGGIQDLDQYNLEPKTTVIVKPDQSNQNFKTVKTPSHGTVQLVKGIGKVVHHSIKEDSVIMLSRKNIEGKVGSHLIIGEIEPNQHFTVHSVSEFEDNNSEVSTGVEVEDFGEIYFLII